MTKLNLSAKTARVRVLAFSIHVLTALGAALALLALLAAASGNWPLMFLWLGLALIIDAVDGPLARAVGVAQQLPRWSGDVLDLVVDYTTYVFVPAYAIAAGGLMPVALAVPAAVIVVITGTLYFADRTMKTGDNYFRGFPAVWNVIAFYLLMLKPPAIACAAAVALFAALTFVPVRFIHPFRVRRFRAPTVALLTLWAILAGAAVRQGLAPDLWIAAALCLIAVYFLTVGLAAARSHPR
jgi:phosphatidylcholine synthase